MFDFTGVRGAKDPPWSLCSPQYSDWWKFLYSIMGKRGFQLNWNSLQLFLPE